MNAQNWLSPQHAFQKEFEDFKKTFIESELILKQIQLLVRKSKSYNQRAFFLLLKSHNYLRGKQSETKYQIVQFCDIPPKKLGITLKRMAGIASQEDFIVAGTADEITDLINSKDYNPDQDFIFMLWDDGTVDVFLKSATIHLKVNSTSKF